MKTSQLTGAALDWAVSKCEKLGYDHWWQPEIGPSQPDYSTDWAQGGPIIEREKIKVDPRCGNWECTIWNEPRICNPSYGPTPLIAAMRCYVASKLGAEIDIPKELQCDATQ